MESPNEIIKEVHLEEIISTSIKIPGVKVDRNKLLAEFFASSSLGIQSILDLGPVEAGVPREELQAIANKLIIKRTSQSSLASFVAGIPGGLAMAATIPADVAQFFGMALRLAQELSYLYGAKDLFVNGEVDDERVKNQLILYCGVMFGVSGAVSGVRVLTTQIAKTAGKKIPQQALTKTFWYPIIKKIGKAIGVKITKTTIGNAAEKVIPVVGGVISGTLNFASMMPMAKRLFKTLDDANFDYSEEEFNSDIKVIEQIGNDEEIILTEHTKVDEVKEKLAGGIKTVGDKASDLIGRIGKKNEKSENADPVEEIKKYKELLDLDIISQEEFDEKKKELLGF